MQITHLPIFAEVELFVILSPTGPYFSTGIKPVNLMADPNYVRAWPGGKQISITLMDVVCIKSVFNKFIIYRLWIC